MSARGFGERVRRTAAWSVVALVAGQAADCLGDTSWELAGRPLQQHLRLFTASPDEIVLATLGDDSDIWLALRASLPRDAHVLLSYSREQGYHALLRRLMKLGSVAYPITMKGWPFDGVEAERRRPKKPFEGFVLDLDSGRDYSGWALLEELARGPGFRLLRIGNRGLEGEAR
jgi:hypothetical protein